MIESFTTRVARSENDLVYFISGKNKGRQAWYYARIDKLKLSLFKRATEGGVFNIADYGVILVSGYGEEPPSYVQQQYEGEED